VRSRWTGYDERVVTRYACAIAASALLLPGTQAQRDVYVPAKLVESALPAAPGDRTPNSGVVGGMIAGGGEVLLEVSIEKDGHVSNIERIRVTPPFTDLLVTAIEGWRFMPAVAGSAREPRHPIASRVLVAALYRMPALYGGTTAGEVPKDVARPSNLIPIPREFISPPYPPNARGSGTVLLEVEVGSDGHPMAVRVVRSGGIFDSAAIQAAERWTFSPAQSLDGGSVPSFAYVVMGFLEPIAPGRAR
jgi:TonB family protein